MQFKTLALLFTSALSISAHPDFLKRGSDDYTCGDAYNDCQGSGKGQYVCYADDSSKSWGKWSGDDMKKYENDKLSDHCKGEAYCCSNDPFIDIELDILNVIEIDIEITLENNCQGSKIWTE